MYKKSTIERHSRASGFVLGRRFKAAEASYSEVIMLFLIPSNMQGYALPQAGNDRFPTSL